MLKKLKKKLSLLLVICIISVQLTGCWDYKDVEKRSIVLTIALDKVGNNKVSFDNEVAEFVYSTSAQTHYNLIQYHGEGSNFDRARVDIETTVRNELNNGSVRALVIGEEFAKEEGINEYLNRINKLYDIRKTINLVISKVPTEELMKTSVKNNRSIGFFVEDNIRTLFMNSHINVTLAKAVSDSRVDGLGSLIPCIDLVDGNLKYVGLGVIKNSKLIDILPLWDTTGLLLVDAPKVPLVITLPDPKALNNTVVFKLTKVKKKIKTSFENDEVNINLTLNVRASLTHQYEIIPQTESDIEALQEALCKNLKALVEEAIKKSQNQYQIDLFEFVKYFKAQNPIKYRSINWSEAYPKSKVNVEVAVNLTDKNGMEYENKQKLNKR